MLQKQSMIINFQNGVDTKTDFHQVQADKFLSMENSVFTKGGLLQKRNGFQSLTSLPDATSTYLTTFNGNLTAVGSKFQALSENGTTWLNKGPLLPVDVNVMPLVRSNANQTICDTAISPNNLICTVWTETNPSGRNPVSNTKYVIADSVTGQNVTAPAPIPFAGGSSTSVTQARVFVLGTYFVLVFNNTISGTTHLQYIAIPYANPTSVGANMDISTNTAPLEAFDGVVAASVLYVGWYGGDGALHINSLSAALSLGAGTSFAAQTSAIISACADVTGTPVIYFSTYDGSANGYVQAINPNLSTALAATQYITGETVDVLASAAQNGGVTIFYQVQNFYSYDSNIQTDYIKSRTCTVGGSLGTAVVVLRSVGLGSKAFIVGGNIYFLCQYASHVAGGETVFTVQPTYFLSDVSGNISAKLAYGNANQSYVGGWASVYVNGTTARVSYLIQDLIQAANKGTNLPAGSQTAGIYTQVGINLATFTIGIGTLSSAEIGNDLNISSGLLWSYDGFVATENGFNLYPDFVEASADTVAAGLSPLQYFYQATYEWSDNQGNIFKSAPSIPVTYTILTPPVSFTGNRTSGSNILTSISSFTGLQIGQAISGTGIPANTFITGFNVGLATLAMSNNASSGTNTVTTVTPTAVTSILINVPTLRVTYKTANPVKIVIYRWSTGQPIYYQVTSLTTPVFNDPTIDSVSWSDRLSDAQILGNNIIYTNGGVVENIGAPANAAVTLFDNRLWLIDAEDRNLLWFSKQIIESTPVEMSDLLTFFVAPTTGAQGSTGPCRCIFPLDDKLIIFKDNAIYYVNGTGPDNTGANNNYSQPIFITSAVGCSNQRSIVCVPQGLQFESNKGIWLLGRDLQTQYIGAAVESFNSATVNSALAIPGTNQVRFGLNTGTSLMFDFYYGQWGTFTGISSISATLYQGLHTFMNSAGQIFQEDPGTYLDGANPVLMSFTTAWLNLINFQGYQRAYFFYILGTYYSPHFMNLAIAYDFDSTPTQTVVINPITDPAAASISGTLENWRIFLKKQRCQAVQIQFSETYNAAYAITAGQGLSISGLNVVIGAKKSFRPISNAKSAGRS